ncbi:MAG: DUF4292 domain-containing protein [Bacteroidia bacterium]
MNKRLLTIILTLIVIIGISACKTKKTVQAKSEFNNKSVKRIANLVELTKKAKNSENLLYYKADVSYKDAKQDISLDMEIQLSKDKYIWMGIKALGFVNVARVMIQPDSIRILDLMNKVYISASYEYMRNFTSAPIQFEQLQNIFMGNAPFDPSFPGANIDTTGTELKISQFFASTLQNSYHFPDYKAHSATLKDTLQKQELTILYDHFNETGQNKFPSTIEIHIQSEKKVDCKFELNNFAFSQKREAQFAVPKTYKVKVY